MRRRAWFISAPVVFIHYAVCHLRAFEAQTPEFDRLIQRLASAVCRAPLVGFPAPEAAPLASREAFQGRGMEENFQAPETRARLRPTFEKFVISSIFF